jgi:hypothetical protein
MLYLPKCNLVLCWSLFGTLNRSLMKSVMPSFAVNKWEIGRACPRPFESRQHISPDNRNVCGESHNLGSRWRPRNGLCGRGSLTGRGVLTFCYRHVQNVPGSHQVKRLYYCPFEISAGLQFLSLAAISAGNYSVDPVLQSKSQLGL